MSVLSVEQDVAAIVEGLKKNTVCKLWSNFTLVPPAAVVHDELNITLRN